VRVLHVNDYRAGGGCEVLVAATLDLLHERDIDVDLFTSEDLPDQHLTPRRYVDNSIARAALRQRLESFAPDAVHLHNFYHILSPGILAELATWKRIKPDARVVMTAHDCHL